MRVAFMIICLAAIAMTLVAMRAEEVSVQQDIQRIQSIMVDQRRQLWRLDASLGELKSMMAVNVRAEEMGLSLLAPDEKAEQSVSPDGNLVLWDNDSQDILLRSHAEFWRPSGGGG